MNLNETNYNTLIALEISKTPFSFLGHPILHWYNVQYTAIAYGISRRRAKLQYGLAKIIIEQEVYASVNIK